MSIIQVIGTGKSVVSDRMSFVGARVPNEIKTMIVPLSKLTKQKFRKLIQLIVSDLEGQDVNNSLFKSEISNEMSEQTLSVIYSGLHSLLVRALRLPATSLKPEMFKDDLTDLQIPEGFQADLASVVFGVKRPNIDQKALASRPRLPRLETLKWRVDVAISTSVLNRVLDPSILMEMMLSNGTIHTFEVR
ncbi:hypothetical protein ScPMuIL_011483 [Solemya velum]